jgi:histidyl-tRNA synthetase
MKPAVPKGTRDFSPEVMAKRNFIIQTIVSVFQRYGYRQIETPAMENLSTLEGKYGEEGDKLLFRILNSGPVLDEIRKKGAEVQWSDLTEKGLRYDLTVPFARYVVMHQHEITLPFKRYQVQPVWRADRPQKGRYREFIQCDADVIGSASLLNEVEMALMIGDVFKQLNINIHLRLNHRKVLAGICEYIGEAHNFLPVTLAIDKMEKAGRHQVAEELRSRGIKESSIKLLMPLLEDHHDPSLTLEALSLTLKDSATGMTGIAEIKHILDLLSVLNVDKQQVRFDVTLARGLNYYTGTILEVKVNEKDSTYSGSLLGGGRYDDLTGIFGMPGISGVGISFGIDRIYDVMEELDLFKPLSVQSFATRILFVNFGEEEARQCLPWIQQVRTVGINAELYPDAVKLKKQLGYAHACQIPYVALVGSEEIKTGMITLRHMATGVQERISIENLIRKIAVA